MDRDSAEFLGAHEIGGTTIFGVALGGEGGISPLHWMQSANWFHNLIQAFLSPLATGWYVTIGEGDALVVPPMVPHYVVNEGQTIQLRWMSRAQDYSALR